MVWRRVARAGNAQKPDSGVRRKFRRRGRPARGVNPAQVGQSRKIDAFDMCAIGDQKYSARVFQLVPHLALAVGRIQQTSGSHLPTVQHGTSRQNSQELARKMATTSPGFRPAAIMPRASFSTISPYSE